MAEEYSAGTISADLTVDATGLNKGVTDATDGFDRLERKLEEVVAAIREGMGKATEATEEATEKVKRHKDALHELKEVAEAIGLYELFEKSKEIALESVNAFDQNVHALHAMQAAVDETDSEKFAEMAEHLSDISRNSVATENTTIALASRFGLTDQAITGLLPKVQDFAARTGKDLPSAMQAFAIAMASGEASPRRMGLALDDMQKQAFKAGDESDRLGILMQALGKYAGGAQQDVTTAAGALARMHNANEELISSIGSMLDKPLATFFNAVSDVVKACTDFFNHLNEPIKELIGYTAALATGLVTLTAGLGAAYKALGLIVPLFTSLGEALPVVVTGVRSLTAAFIPFTLPILGALAAITGLTLAYGMFRNAMENKEVPASFGEYLKQSVERTKNDLLGIIGDFHEKIAGGEEGDQAFKGGADKGLDFGKDATEYSYKAFGGINSAMDAKKSETMDFGKPQEIGDAIADAFGTLDFSEEGGGLFGKKGDTGTVEQQANVSDAIASIADVGDQMGLTKDKLAAFTNGLVDSFSKTIDANADLQEAQAKAQDEVLQGQQDEINRAGGIFTEAFAGITVDMTRAQKEAALANASPAAQAGGVAVSAISSAGGTAGAVAGGLAAAATGNPIGLASAGMALLEQSKSFQTIMNLINKTLSVLVQAINPILNAVIPALTVVLSIVGDVVKTIIKNLTPLMAPIMKLITTIVLIAKPFIQIFEQLQSVLIPILTKLIVPVINALSAALMFVAKIVIDGIVNPLIEAWDAIIDAIDDVLGWLGVDLSSLKMHTISLEDDSDAVDTVTDSMNQLDQSSQNIPEGYKVALSAFNAASGASLLSGSSVSSGNSSATSTPPSSTAIYHGSIQSQVAQNSTINQAVGGNTDDAQMARIIASELKGNYDSADAATSAAKSAVSNQIGSSKWDSSTYQKILDAVTQVALSEVTGTSKTPNTIGVRQARFAVAPSAGNTPTTSATTTTTANSSQVRIETVNVQAATPDLLSEMQKMLKNRGYLMSGTNMTGASQRTQYGSA